MDTSSLNADKDEIGIAGIAAEAGRQWGHRRECIYVGPGHCQEYVSAVSNNLRTGMWGVLRQVRNHNTCAGKITNLLIPSLLSLSISLFPHDKFRHKSKYQNYRSTRTWKITRKHDPAPQAVKAILTRMLDSQPARTQTNPQQHLSLLLPQYVTHKNRNHRRDLCSCTQSHSCKCDQKKRIQIPFRILGDFGWWRGAFGSGWELGNGAVWSFHFCILGCMNISVVRGWRDV
jgi:hypothetical protein